MLQCPSILKQINFKMECFSSLSDKPSIYYKYRGDLLQHSVDNQNNEIQEQWPLAPMLVYDSIHPWARSQVPLILYLVLFPLCSSLLWELRDNGVVIAILTLKPRSHVRILIYRTTGLFSDTPVELLIDQKYIVFLFLFFYLRPK